MTNLLTDGTTEEEVNAIVVYDPPSQNGDGPHDEERDDGPAAPRARQLSFNVGGAKPDRSSLKLTADLSIERELRKGTEVRAVIYDAFGEVIATSAGKVVSVNFKDEYQDGYIVGTDRIHTVKL